MTRPTKKSIDTKTGIVTSVELTDEEMLEFEANVAESKAKMAAEEAARPLKEVIAKRTAKLDAGGYGTTAEQFEMIGELGYDAYQAHIQAVKLRFPKPE